MVVFPQIAYNFPLPQMIPVRQNFPDERIEDVNAAVDREFAREEIRSRIFPGASVAVLVGSRGICDIHIVVRRVIQNIKHLGGNPFIVPAMGSHGNGNAEEQQKILESYQITEAFTGAPIRSSMDTVLMGKSEDGVEVYADKNAANADIIIPVCRIKCHTVFHGPYESGICKMLTIGLGKHKGCSRLHQENIDNFATVLPKAAKVVIEKLPVAFAIALIENAHEHLHTICAVPAEEIMEKEPELLKLSKSLMPRLQFDHLDVLVVQQIGKDITGDSMDPNITGRLAEHPPTEYNGPDITRIVVNDISEGAHGNVIGVGTASFITKKAVDKIDFDAMYTNCIASTDPHAGRIPIVLADEETALRAAIFNCPRIDHSQAKVVWIKDTLHLIDIKVSESLLKICEADPAHFTVL